jgi:hypothetical protein
MFYKLLQPLPKHQIHNTLGTSHYPLIIILSIPSDTFELGEKNKKMQGIGTERRKRENSSLQ